MQNEPDYEVQHAAERAVIMAFIQECAMLFTKALREQRFTLEELRVGLTRPEAKRFLAALIELRDATTAVTEQQASDMPKHADLLKAAVWPER